jgi:hypothetical protein
LKAIEAARDLESMTIKSLINPKSPYFICIAAFLATCLLQEVLYARIYNKFEPYLNADGYIHGKVIDKASSCGRSCSFVVRVSVPGAGTKDFGYNAIDYKNTEIGDTHYLKPNRFLGIHDPQVGGLYTSRWEDVPMHILSALKIFLVVCCAGIPILRLLNAGLH